MMKFQYASSEPLRLVFPAFFSSSTGLYILGGDTASITVKKPDGTTTVLVPTFDNDVKFWIAEVSNADFQEGLWLAKATSTGGGAYAQYKALVWGDYVDDIQEARQAALGKWKVEGTVLKIFEDDGVTVFREYQLLDENGNPSNSRIFERTPI